MPGKSGRSTDDAKLAALKLGFTRGKMAPDGVGPGSRSGTGPLAIDREPMPILTRVKIRQSVGGSGPSSRSQSAMRQQYRNLDERVLAPRIARLNRES